ncbi:MAG: sugar phosphate nucleotidyltransferase [Acidimicrobiia bacterium]
MILAGGLGTRLRPFTHVTPKPLLPVANRSLLEWQVRWLAGYGVDEVILAIGYQASAFAEQVAQGRQWGVELRHVVEQEPLGTGGAIRFALPESAERFLVCNGDVLTDLALGELIDLHERTAALATIALTRVEDPSAFGVVPTDADGKVEAFLEKPDPGDTACDWVNAGTYVLEPAVLRTIPADRKVSVEREIFPGLLSRGERLSALQSPARWLDVGTPANYLRANGYALSGLFGPPPGGQTSPGVFVDGPVEVDRESTLEAPVVLGPGALAGAGAQLARSALGPGCVVEARSVVRDSVLHRGAHVGADCEVLWSVLGAGARVGDRTVVVGAMIAPGELVPPGSRITGELVESAGGRKP